MGTIEDGCAMQKLLAHRGWIERYGGGIERNGFGKLGI